MRNHCRMQQVSAQIITVVNDVMKFPASQIKFMDFSKVTDHFVIAMAGGGFVEVLQSSTLQEWVKIAIQAAIGVVTIYTLIINAKKHGFHKKEE